MNNQGHCASMWTTESFYPKVASIFALAAVMLCGVSARAAKIKKMKLDGHIAIQGEMENTDKMGVDDVEAKLTLKTPRYKGTRAVIAVEGKYYRQVVYFEDLYIDHKFNDRIQLTAGISKKVLGLEYENSSRYRATIHRSPVYQQMEKVGVVGRQLNFKLNVRSKKHDGFRLSCALGADGTRDVNLLFSLQKPLGVLGVGTWLLLEAHKVNSYYDPLYFQTFALWSDLEYLRISLELFAGNNSNETEYNEIFGDNRTVFMGGAKFETLTRFRFTKVVTLSPVFQTSFWASDLDHYLNNTLQFLLGARLQVRRISISLNGSITGDRLESSWRRSFDDKAIYVEMRYDF